MGKGPNKKTIDLGELYGGLENVDLVQLGYERHSKYMQSLLDENDKKIEFEQAKEDAIEEAQSMYNNFKKEAAATPHKTIDTHELYDQIALQTGETKNQFYEKHSRAWEREVEKATDKLEDQMEELEDQEEENSHRKKTIDIGELYDNINLQTRHRTRHSDAFEARVQAYEEAMEQDQKDDEAVVAKKEAEEKARSILAQGMTPAPAMMPELRHPNPSVNMAELYSGLDEPSFV